jgi:hypothetical protein
MGEGVQHTWKESTHDRAGVCEKARAKKFGKDTQQILGSKQHVRREIIMPET